MRKMKQLYELIDINSPEAVYDEMTRLFETAVNGWEKEPLRSAFETISDLFAGRYVGYKACNTEYHDFRHTIETFLAMGRLIHGALLSGVPLPRKHVETGLIAALFHDTGYIQEEKDRKGTGAKHTTTHVRRSADFFDEYGRQNGMPDSEIALGCAMISCTDLTYAFTDINFPDSHGPLLGRMLGAADLLAQMADRTYLEKLLFLYHEFREAGIKEFGGELDLLEKTVGFYGFIEQRLDSISDQIDNFMFLHFKERWQIEANLYREAIERQKAYLVQILSQADTDPREHLKRYGIVQKVREKYGDHP